jgi:hypothetical protein
MSPLRVHLFTALLGLSLCVSAAPGFAQVGGGHGGQPPQSDDDDAKRKKREQEFGVLNTPLPKIKNAGPCPFVKVLYDAARYVQFKNDQEAYANVGYTGEIENMVSACAYKSDEPIVVRARLLFEFGRGPEAVGREKTYRYWVAVTDRNHAVLQKVWFDLPVTFPPGQDRVTKIDTINRIVIPRQDAKVSGANFEVLVGFDVTPQMASFNRDGKRFRADVGQPEKVAAAKP